jgi:hypothetical protein
MFIGTDKLAQILFKTLIQYQLKEGTGSKNRMGLQNVNKQ